MLKSKRILISCEHGGAKIPRPFSGRFHCPQSIVKSHRGFDYGALDIARAISSDLGAPLLKNEVTRLLIDLNRSPENPDRTSRWSSRFTDSLDSQIYRPYWDSAFKFTAHAPVIHLSVHSFTPVLKGKSRPWNAGILFDPDRPREAALARHLRSRLKQNAPLRKIGFNVPYAGIEDGLTQSLRKSRAPSRYIGIELEFNQSMLKRYERNGMRSTLNALIANAIKTALLSFEA